MPFAYPVMLEVEGKRCVVIGDDAVHEGKVDGLLAAGATDVLVVAEAPVGRLDELERMESVTVERRSWRCSDLNGAFLVVGASRDAGERAAIAREARCRNALVNVVDDIPNCDFAAPSVVRRGELLLAIGTGGATPALAKKIRVELEERYGPEWGEVVGILREVRDETTPSLPSFRERAERWSAALDPDEAAALVRDGRGAELRSLLIERLVGDRREAEQP
ncbi:MAG TPA: bifunctional precorrin-2 dehydrogenase/sirohydrochlorin ferrochelatase [Actinomycetota bacterium]|nr:bifunctional precorrin-2 dehydrogenase/sirohydrochlorin ferrochelatase [Actinomycetota bacterium]